MKNSLLLILLFLFASYHYGFAQPVTEVSFPANSNFDYVALIRKANADLLALEKEILVLRASTKANDLCALEVAVSDYEYVQWFVSHAEEVKAKIDEYKVDLKPNGALLSGVESRAKLLATHEILVNATQSQIEKRNSLLKQLSFNAQDQVRVTLNDLTKYFDLFNERIASCPKDAVERENTITLIKTQFQNPLVTPVGITIAQAEEAAKRLQESLNASLSLPKFNYQLKYTSPNSLECTYGFSLIVTPVDLNNKSELSAFEIKIDQSFLLDPAASVIKQFQNRNFDSNLIFKADQGDYTASSKGYSFDALVRYAQFQDQIPGHCITKRIDPNYIGYPYMTPGQIRISKFKVLIKSNVNKENATEYYLNGIAHRNSLNSNRELIVTNLNTKKEYNLGGSWAEVPTTVVIDGKPLHFAFQSDNRMILRVKVGLEQNEWNASIAWVKVESFKAFVLQDKVVLTGIAYDKKGYVAEITKVGLISKQWAVSGIDKKVSTLKANGTSYTLE